MLDGDKLRLLRPLNSTWAILDQQQANEKPPPDPQVIIGIIALIVAVISHKWIIKECPALWARIKAVLLDNRVTEYLGRCRAPRTARIDQSHHGHVEMSASVTVQPRIVVLGARAVVRIPAP